MSQYTTGTVSVNNGSAVVTGSGTVWSTNVAVGDLFLRNGDGVSYFIGSVDSNTQVTLTANYAGVTGSGASYEISTSFTSNYDFPLLADNDLETGVIYSRAMQLIDSKIAQVAAAGAAPPIDIGDLTDFTITGAAKGDILVYNGTNWVDMTVGTDGYVLESRASEATGLKWVAYGGGETNTASNVNVGGVGVFKQKTSQDLEFKGLNAGSSKITVTDDTGNNEIDIDVAEANLTIANMSDYDANKFVDHSGVSISTAANSGLTGGGDLTSTRSLSVDINGTASSTPDVTTDEIIFYDTSAAGNRKATINQIFSLGPAFFYDSNYIHHHIVWQSVEFLATRTNATGSVVANDGNLVCAENTTGSGKYYGATWQATAPLRSYSWDNNRKFKVGALFTITGNQDYYISTGDSVFSTSQRGFGFWVNNGSLVGYSDDGTTRSTQSLSTSVSDGVAVVLEAVKTSGQVEFFVNGVSKGTVSSNIPSGTTDAQYVLAFESVSDTSTAQMELGEFEFLQSN